MEDSKVNRALQAVRRIDDSPDLVDIMISVEDYLDRNDIYAFKNWIHGELIDGPHIGPYWIKVAFKWSHSCMPDPRGGLRLLPHGTRVRFGKECENVPQPIEQPGDYEPGTKKPKIKKEMIWVVELAIPRRFIEDIETEIMDLYDDRVDDMETVEDAEAEGNTEEDVGQGQQDSLVP